MGTQNTEFVKFHRKGLKFSSKYNAQFIQFQFFVKTNNWGDAYKLIQQQIIKHMIKNIKEVIKELDFFQHPQLLRYQSEPGYRTFTGGLVSVAVIVIFASLFSNLVLNTLNNNLVKDQINISYDSDPNYYDLTANSQKSHFMFALGIDDLDLNTQRYFDIVLQNVTMTKNSSGTFKITNTVPLNRCNSSQWSGINDQISQAFNTLNFSRWLCPPTDYTFSLQGKFTSTVFKYARVLINKCGTLLNSSTCSNSSDVASFIQSNQGVTANFYYVNPVINAGDTDYLNYYLEDSNYFSFNTLTGINANLFFTQYNIETDHSIFPWSYTTEDRGALTSSSANSQTYSVTDNNQYAKIYLRKSSQRLDISRKFAKIDQTFAFIGGLLGFLLLILTFMKLYSKYSFEIEFGDRIFKRNSNGSFGSQQFNFIVFLGYGIYNILTIFGVHLRWYAMRKYHECRIQCMKQLDIHLLFKKIQFFEQLGNIILEDHHIKGLFMLPKKKIKQIQQSRRRFLLQPLLYEKLDKKAHEVVVDQSQYRKRYEQFFNSEENRHKFFPDKQFQQSENKQIKKLKLQCSQSYKKLQHQSFEGQKISKRIFDKINIKEFNKYLKGQKQLYYQIPIHTLPSVVNLKSSQHQQENNNSDNSKPQHS